MYIFAYGTGIILAVFYYAAGNEPATGSLNAFEILVMAVTILFFVVYYTFSEAVSRGRSLGKLVTRTKVVKLDDTEIGWKEAFICSISRLVPFEPFSALGGYPWHDAWSKIKVIKLKK